MTPVRGITAFDWASVAHRHGCAQAHRARVAERLKSGPRFRATGYPYTNIPAIPATYPPPPPGAGTGPRAWDAPASRGCLYTRSRQLIMGGIGGHRGGGHGPYQWGWQGAGRRRFLLVPPGATSSSGRAGRGAATRRGVAAAASERPGGERGRRSALRGRKPSRTTPERVPPYWSESRHPPAVLPPWV